MPSYRENSDMNGVPDGDRYAYIYMRAQSFCLVDWFFHTYDFALKGKTSTKSAAHKAGFSDPFGALCATLYLQSKELQEFHPDIPYEAIREQLRLCFEKDAVMSEWLQDDKALDCFVWDYAEDWDILRSQSTPFRSKFTFSFGRTQFLIKFNLLNR